MVDSFNQDTDEAMVKTHYECAGVAGKRSGYGCHHCYVGCTNPDRDPNQWTDWKAVGSKNNLNVSFSWKPNLFTPDDVAAFKERFCTRAADTWDVLVRSLYRTITVRSA
jgi:hypothetical protein